VIDLAPTDALARLDARLAVLLPPLYRERYQDMQPVPMRSAPFVYDADGRVAWDQMWNGFCDLAMAGGPPHKGRWLGPGTPDAIAAAPTAHETVVDEIRRGVALATGLDARPADTPGWVPIACYGEAMAEWMTRAVVMENVAARRGRVHLSLPAAPDFRVEKEVRNVITVVAKTSHYWVDHMPPNQQAAIRALFHELSLEGPVVPPAFDDAVSDDASTTLAAALGASTGLDVTRSATPGWVGVPCHTVDAAIWMMRALVAHNVLARREETTLLVPANAAVDPGGALVAARVARVHALARHAGRA
jgi:hypothetical protein